MIYVYEYHRILQNHKNNGDFIYESYLSDFNVSKTIQKHSRDAPKWSINHQKYISLKNFNQIATIDMKRSRYHLVPGSEDDPASAVHAIRAHAAGIPLDRELSVQDLERIVHHCLLEKLIPHNRFLMLTISVETVCAWITRLGTMFSFIN